MVACEYVPTAAMSSATSFHQRCQRHHRGASNPLTVDSSSSGDGGGVSNNPLLAVRKKSTSVWQERRRRSASAVLFAAAAAVCGNRPQPPPPPPPPQSAPRLTPPTVSSSGCDVTMTSSASASSIRHPSPPVESAQLAPLSAPDSAELLKLVSAMNRPATSRRLFDSFQTLRSRHPSRFRDLCQVHLSFLIDVPVDFAEEQSEHEREASRELGNDGSTGGGLHDVNRVEQLFSSSTNTTDITDGKDLREVDALLSLLSARSPVDGLFRKCGSAARLRQLRDRLAEAPTAGAATLAEFASGCSSHDLAGALKASLAALSEPLLTSRLLPYFRRAAGIGYGVPGSASVATASVVASAKRLKAFRILIQLMPWKRRQFLARLLTEVARLGLARVTQMSSECLGVLFGPVLLYPPERHEKKKLIDEARAQAAVLNSATAFLFENAAEVMQIPETVSIDADRILRSVCRRQRFNFVVDANLDSSSPPPLSVRFATWPLSPHGLHAPASSCDYTKHQLDMLFASVQSMPESNRKLQLTRLLCREGRPVTTTAGSDRPSRRCHVISSPVSTTLDFPMQGLSPESQLENRAG